MADEVPTKPKRELSPRDWKMLGTLPVTKGHLVRGLNSREMEFVLQFILNRGDSKAAAVAAGYSTINPQKWAAKLMKRPTIQAEIARRRQQAENRTLVTSDRIIAELGFQAFYDVGEIVEHEIKTPEDIKKLPEHVRRAITGWKWEGGVKHRRLVLKFASKTEALNLLGQHFGLWRGAGAPVGGQPDETAAEREARRAAIRAKFHGLLQQMAVPEPLVLTPDGKIVEAKKEGEG